MLEFELIQIVLGHATTLSSTPTAADWRKAMGFAEKQGLIGLMFSGIEKLPKPQLPPMENQMDWLGQVEYMVSMYNEHRGAKNLLCSISHKL